LPGGLLSKEQCIAALRIDKMLFEEKLLVRQSLKNISCQVNGRIPPLWITGIETVAIFNEVPPQGEG
jgi:hypothetical protein